MRSSFRGMGLSARAWAYCFCTVLFLYLPAQADPARRPTKIIFREDVPLARRNQLAKDLGKITGWTDLKFDKNGSLELGTGVPTAGSETARTLLTDAVSGANVLILEDVSSRSDVVFCRVVPGRWKKAAPRAPPVYVVLIDFADFDHLMGDALALNAFDVGWGVLHELDHVVNDSSDAEWLSHTGECEDHINQMRRECHLPERTDYFFSFFPNTESSPFSTRLVRLPFAKRDMESNRSQRYWLFWDAALVGGLNESIAGL